MSVSGFLLSRCNFPSPRKIFLYLGPCLRVAHRRGGRGRHWLGAASGQILQIFPAWARLWAEPRLARTAPARHCLARAGPGSQGDLPRSLESGSLCAPCTLAHCTGCTGHSCTVQESLHICICNELIKLLRRFLQPQHLLSTEDYGEIFFPSCIRIRV